MTLFNAIYESGPNGLWVFLLITVVIGGVMAWVTGKAIAQTWRPFWHVPAYCLLLALAVRFLHFALFEEPLVSVTNYLVDYAVLSTAALVGHRTARAFQMSTQYSWLFLPAGSFGWRRKGHD